MRKSANARDLIGRQPPGLILNLGYVGRANRFTSPLSTCEPARLGLFFRKTASHVSRTCPQGLGAAGAAPAADGGTVDVPAGLPDGAPKYLKKSESGRSR